MVWVEAVTLLAVIQFYVFGFMVGKARTRFKTPAPKMTGDPVFERYVRVQENTLEMIVIFLPSLWIAARYWNPLTIAGIGAVYLIGRQVYASAYVKDPAKRTVGFALTMLPTSILIVMAFVGMAVAHR